MSHKLRRTVTESRALHSVALSGAPNPSHRHTPQLPRAKRTRALPSRSTPGAGRARTGRRAVRGGRGGAAARHQRVASISLLHAKKMSRLKRTANTHRLFGFAQSPRVTQLEDRQDPLMTLPRKASQTAVGGRVRRA